MSGGSTVGGTEENFREVAALMGGSMETTEYSACVHIIDAMEDGAINRAVYNDFPFGTVMEWLKPYVNSEADKPIVEKFAAEVVRLIDEELAAQKAA